MITDREHNRIGVMRRRHDDVDDIQAKLGELYQDLGTIVESAADRGNLRSCISCLQAGLGTIRGTLDRQTLGFLWTDRP